MTSWNEEDEKVARTIIDALYDGNLDFIIGKRGTSTEYRKAMSDLMAVQDKLTQALPEDQRGLVEEISTTSTNANHFDCKQHFEKGYRLGAMLMLAVFTTPVELKQ